jgi:hypothetical protein
MGMGRNAGKKQHRGPSDNKAINVPFMIYRGDG